MKSKGEIYFEEFLERFDSLSDQEIVELFNKEVGNNGWGTARAAYLAAIHHEFERRKIDYSDIGDSKSISFNNKIVLINSKVVLESKV